MHTRHRIGNTETDWRVFVWSVSVAWREVAVVVKYVWGGYVSLWCFFARCGSCRVALGPGQSGIPPAPTCPSQAGNCLLCVVFMMTVVYDYSMQLMFRSGHLQLSVDQDQWRLIWNSWEGCWLWPTGVCLLNILHQHWWAYWVKLMWKLGGEIFVWNGFWGQSKLREL